MVVMMVLVVVVAVVTMMKTMIMKTGLSGAKMTISMSYHFVPYLVINHLEMDK
jgi:hypothetical protein